MEFIYNYSIHISSFLLVIAGYVVSKSMQGIADDYPEISQRVFKKVRSQLGRQDSNLRPSEPKALDFLKIKYPILLNLNGQIAIGLLPKGQMVGWQ